MKNYLKNPTLQEIEENSILPKLIIATKEVFKGLVTRASQSRTDSRELIATCDHLLAATNHSREWKFTRASRVEHVQPLLYSSG